MFWTRPILVVQPAVGQQSHQVRDTCDFSSRRPRRNQAMFIRSSVSINRSCLVFIASRLHVKGLQGFVFSWLGKLVFSLCPPSALLILLQMHLAHVFEANRKNLVNPINAAFRLRNHLIAIFVVTKVAVRFTSQL